MDAPLPFAADHPAFCGHFPNFPVLPGALLLDAAVSMIARDRALQIEQWQVSAAKFLDMVRPGDALRLEHQQASSTSLNFTISCGSRRIATGILSARSQPR